MYLTLRTGCERHARVTRLPRPFPAYAVYHLHPSYPNKGKVGVQRGRKTAGCPSFLPLPRGAARSRGARHVPAVRRRRIPPLRCSEKLPARKGRTRLRQFAYPAQPVLKKTSARQGRTRFRSSRAPAIRCRNGLCPPLEHKKRNPYGFLFEIALPYQDALRTPGIWPL